MRTSASAMEKFEADLRDILEPTQRSEGGAGASWAFPSDKRRSKVYIQEISDGIEVPSNG